MEEIFVESARPASMMAKCTTAKPMTDAKENVPETLEFTEEHYMQMCNQLLIEEIGLAEAYIPFQMSGQTMSEEQSLCAGTAFAELVSPYKKGSGLY